MLGENRLFSYLFFLRFPLLTATALMLLPLLQRLAPDLLVLSGWNTALVIMLGLGAAWSCMFAALVLIEAAPHRFSILALRPPPWILKSRFVLSAMIVLPMAVSLIAYSENKGVQLLMIGLGIALAASGVVAAKAAYQLLAASDHTLGIRGRSFRRWVVGSTRDDQGRPAHAGAIFLVMLFVLLTAISVTENWRAAWYMQRGNVVSLLPTLAYLELLIFQWALLLPALSFFLDRYRIPIFLIVVLWFAAPSLIVGTRHYFMVTPASCGTHDSRKETSDCSLPTPLDASIEPWLREEESRAPGRQPVAFAVATSGGGIHASAWTTRVLTGLQEEFGTRFTHAIRLVSAASGGSVGTMFFIASYEPELGAPPPDQLPYINQAATTACDDAVAWGLMRTDLLRLFCPMIDKIDDRGLALEETWRHALRRNGQDYSITSRVSDWRTGARDGSLPGVIFNATIMETSQPILFGTIAVDPPPSTVVFGEGENGYGGTDVDVVTAVRLSATFAWVSPLARAHYEDRARGLPSLSHQHIGDGGYYDMLGVQSALDWSIAAMEKYKDRLAGIVIIQIRNERGFPKTDIPGFVQSMGPIVTSMSELHRVQYQRNQADMQRARRLSGGFIDTVVFAPRHDSEKAWALKPGERELIESDWREFKNSEQMTKLRNWFQASSR